MLPPKHFVPKLNPKEGLKLELKVANICHEMSLGGFTFDKEEAIKQVADLQERIDWCDQAILPLIPPTAKKLGTEVTKLYKINGEYVKAVADYWGPDVCNVEGPYSRVEWVNINLDSPKQVMKWLDKNGWVPTEWNYKKDKAGKEIKDREGNKIKTSPKLSEDSFESLEALGPAGTIISYRRKCTHKRNQILGLLENVRPDGTIPSVVNTIGAATHRMTHSIVANIPAPKKGKFWKPMRKCFRAPEGYAVVGCDADQCQIRALAHYLNDAEFIDALLNGNKNDGTDIHSLNGKRAGIDREEAKGVFYGYLFGAGVAKTASQLGVSNKQAEIIRGRFEAGLPALTTLISTLNKLYHMYGYIVGIDGGRVYCTSPHMLLVYLLQNFEAILMKVAMCYAYDSFKKEKLDARFVTIQHDEFQTVVREDHAQRVAQILEESLVKAGTFIGSLCPIKGKAQIGKTWYHTH